MLVSASNVLSTRARVNLRVHSERLSWALPHADGDRHCCRTNSHRRAGQDIFEHNSFFFFEYWKNSLVDNEVHVVHAVKIRNSSAKKLTQNKSEQAENGQSWLRPQDQKYPWDSLFGNVCLFWRKFTFNSLCGTFSCSRSIVPTPHGVINVPLLEILPAATLNACNSVHVLNFILEFIRNTCSTLKSMQFVLCFPSTSWRRDTRTVSRASRG